MPQPTINPRTAPGFDRFVEPDQALGRLGPKIRVLKSIGWPRTAEAEFLAGWRKGDPRIPVPSTQPQDLHAER
jgi:hypothetical protein